MRAHGMMLSPTYNVINLKVTELVIILVERTMINETGKIMVEVKIIANIIIVDQEAHYRGNRDRRKYSL